MRKKTGIGLILTGLLLAADAPQAAQFRFALTEVLVSKDVTMAETKRAMALWATEIKRQLPDFVTMDVTVLSFSEMYTKVRNRELEAFVVSAFEYPKIAPLIDSVIMTNEAAPQGDEYLLLVNRASGIQSLEDLRGRRLSVYDHPKMRLSRYWLDNLLVEHKLAPTEPFFSQVTANAKPSLTVLAVFFKTADACLVSKRSFATMTELNPQLGAKLVPLAESPKLISSVLVFRKDMSQQTRSAFEKAVVRLKTAPAGQQALALFDGTGIVRADVANLKPALDLIATHSRLRIPESGNP